MATTTCISANIVKTKGNAATLIMAGNVGDTAKNNNLKLTTLSKNKTYNHVFAAVSAASSGNLGTIKPYGAGTFAYQTKNQYIGPIIGKQISGVATTLFQGAANHVQQRSLNKQTTRHTSYLYSLAWTANRDGQPTYSSVVNAQSLNFLADYGYTNTSGVGIFVYRTGKKLPVQATYPKENSN